MLVCGEDCGTNTLPLISHIKYNGHKPVSIHSKYSAIKVLVKEHIFVHLFSK